MLKISPINKNDPNNFPLSPTSIPNKKLTCQLLPLFKILRIIGRCPLQFHNSQTQIYFEFVPNKKSLLSFLSGLLIISFLAFGLVQFGSTGFQLFPFSKEIWPQLETAQSLPPHIQFAYKLMASAEVLSIIHIILEYPISYLTLPLLVKYLNRWNTIQSEFQLEIKNVKNDKLKFAMIYLSIVILTFTSFTFLYELDKINNYPVFVLIHQTYSALSTLLYSTDDIKVFAILNCIKQAFAEISSKLDSTPTKLTKIQIRKLHQLLTAIRCQASSCGKYLAFTQLLSILLSIYFAAATIYISIMLVGNAKMSLIGQMSFFTVFSLVRVYIKIQLGVGITDEENNVADILKKKQLFEDDADCFKSMKGISNMLTTQPTEISLNNYVKLNNSLTLGILGQVSTLFIVFMQLH